MMTRTSSLAAVLLLTGCASRYTPPAFPEVSSLTPQAALPDPLVMLDGRRVTSAAQWRHERRPELQALFQHYMYGPIPPAPIHTQARTLGQYADFLDGQATLKLVTLETGPANAPRIDLLLVVPNQRPGPAPVFLAMNFCGNHALTADARVPLARSWLFDGCRGCTNNNATDAARGAQAADWPLAEIVRRGYALASFCSGDIDPDRKEASEGIYAWLNAADASGVRNNPTNRGTIAAWAWGFHRCVDYLVTEGDVDPHRIAALGHSRNGKTALLAAAFDERIALAFPHQAGCGGSAPSRGKSGESVKAINDHFPHWFNARFKQFNDAPERLPFDQNCLLALCAPRPVLFSAAEGDQWSNPAGQLAILQAADPVYRFLGVEGFNPPAASSAPTLPPAALSPALPALRQLVDSRLGFYIREGKHSMTADDWRVFMDFADKQFGKR
jgi:dienelactone hydrolase